MAVVNDGTAVSHVPLFGALPEGPVVGADFTASVPLDEVSPERIAELHQLLLSIQPDTTVP